MSFTSLEFALFLPLVFLLYWAIPVRNVRAQNLLLLAASYLFYGWWDWRFLGLIGLSTLISYACALARERRRLWTAVSVLANLLILCVFKYFGFFGENLQRLLATFGVAVDWFTIEVLLPVGISFYTFQAVSYSVDVYRGRIQATRKLDTFALYIAFFPQLVAGPIERSTQLLPQFLAPRRWDYAGAVEGVRLILWGLFKKCAVADGVAHFVDVAYSCHAGEQGLFAGAWCLVGVVGFALEIYGDFSGYSDIAKGTARLFGIKLMDNFLYPFFSRNALELWHRWHRSLMQWFTEYVYIPLGGSRRGNKYLHVMAVFLLSGLWHGAAWGFVAWGAACGVWYMVAAACGARAYRPGRDEPPSRADLPKMAATFVMFVAVFVFFRADSLSLALDMFSSLIITGPAFAVGLIGSAWLLRAVGIRMATLVWVAVAGIVVLALIRPAEVVTTFTAMLGYVFGAVVLLAEWRSRRDSFALQRMPRSRWKRLAIYAALYIVVFTCVTNGSGQFIYFKF